MEEESAFFINYDNVITNKTLLNSTRLLAVDITNYGYLSISDYLEKLSDKDLATLIKASEDPDCDEFGEILLVAEMLATGEGLDNAKTEDVMLTRIKVMVAFLAVESLARRGMVRIFRENMSFGEDYNHKNIAERIDE